MRVPTRRQITALRNVGRTREAIDKAAASHHAAIVQALSLGCSQSQLAIELDVSRQAVSEYVRRWLRPHPAALHDDPNKLPLF